MEKRQLQNADHYILERAIAPGNFTGTDKAGGRQ